MRSYRIPLVLLVTVTAVLALWQQRPANEQEATPSQTSLAALVHGESTESSNVGLAGRKSFKSIDPSSSDQVPAEAEIQALADSLLSALDSNKQSADHQLGDEKRAELEQLRAARFATDESRIKFDSAGRLRAIYGKLALTAGEAESSASLADAVGEMVERHTVLFGLGDHGSVDSAAATCAEDFCATKVKKTFYGLPAWDHELTVSSKGREVFAIAGDFTGVALGSPGQYALDPAAAKQAIAAHFSVAADEVGELPAAELGIAKLGTVDYYAFKLAEQSVAGVDYEIYFDAESGHFTSAVPLVQHASASGLDLAGNTVSFDAAPSGGGYVMDDSRFPAGQKTVVFRADLGQRIGSNTLDSGWPAEAVSALAGAKRSVDYFVDTHGYQAINPLGADLYVGVGGAKENAEWNPATNTMKFGVGAGHMAKVGLPYSAALDVIGHEATHGVISSSSILEYRGESGALNESFSDFFGSMIEGKENWTLAEDLLSPSGKPLRNMANPAMGTPAQPSHYSQYVVGGSVHINSGIPNRALYLLAEGLSSEGLGESVGRVKAANLAFKTMIGLTADASFNEAAEYMAEVAKVDYPDQPAVEESTKLAWQKVGIPQSSVVSGPAARTPGDPLALSSVLFLKSVFPFYGDIAPEDNWYTLNLQVFSNSSRAFEEEVLFSVVTSRFSKYTRPALIGFDSDYSVIYQGIDDAYYLRDITGGSGEILLDSGSILAGFDASDSTRLFALSIQNSNKIVVLNLEDKTTTTFNVAVPTTAQNGGAVGAAYVDAVRFDPTGRYLTFDFFTCGFANADCSLGDEGYWSIGILDVFSGEFEFPFRSQPARFNIGFPAFSNTTDRYITFDVREAKDDGVSSYVAVLDRVSAEAWAVTSTDYTTAKLGAWGMPSFSSDDTSIVHSVTYDGFQGMYTKALTGYRPIDEGPKLLNPLPSFKAYATGLPVAAEPVQLTVPSAAVAFSGVLQPAKPERKLCLENRSSFSIEIYSSSMPAGITWLGGNRVLASGSSSCASVILDSSALPVGDYTGQFSVVHNGANSPTAITVSANIDLDSDGDGVGDALDAFDDDPTETTDSDSDGVGDNADAFPDNPAYSADSDGDGLPDAYEVANGLDKNNADDASADLDGDGITNIDEYTAGSDPTRDEAPPTLVYPEVMTVSATGRLTSVSFSEVSATDRKDGAVTPVADNAGPFASGAHIIKWTASDAAGNQATGETLLKVLPLVNLAPSRLVSEGASFEAVIELSGVAAQYPVIVPVTFAGGALNGTDYTTSADEITVTAGTSGAITLAIIADDFSESNEAIEISLGDPTNAVLGAATTQSLTIVEGNIAPELALAVAQDGLASRTVYADGGTVTATAAVIDVNAADTHRVTWDTSAWSASGGDVPEFSTTGATISFDPAGLSSGIYTLSATVADNGSPSQTTQAVVAIKLVATAPLLSSSVDTDGDGIFDSDEGFGDADGDGIPDYKDNITERYLAPASADGKLLMQSSVGTTIALGRSALAADGSSVVLSEDKLAELIDSRDVGFTYPSGLFDFSIAGAVAGESYRVVLPLPSPVPTGAIFRKFIDANIGWQEFEVNAKNSIETAPAANGACPEPGSSVYTAGLNRGDSCIQLLVEEGGPNDADRLVNGVLVDPSGMAVVVFGPPSSSSTVRLSKSTITAGSAEAVTVTVRALDSDGRSLLGMNVSGASAIAGVSVGSFSEDGDGVYTAQLTVGSVTGSGTVEVTIDNGTESISVSAALTVAAQASAASSGGGGGGGGGCAVSLTSTPDSSLLLLMLLGLFLAIRRRLLSRLQTGDL